MEYQKRNLSKILSNLHNRLSRLEEYNRCSQQGVMTLATGMSDCAREVQPRLLCLHVDKWNVTLPEEIPQTNVDYHENWTLQSKIAKINKIYSAIKYDRRRTGEACSEVPRGIHVFECPGIHTIITTRVIAEIERIYKEPRNYQSVPRVNPSDNIIFLRYPPGSGNSQPTYADSLIIMRDLGLQHMLRLVKHYGEQLKNIFTITDEELDESSVSIVRYDGVRNRGIRPHMDNFAPTPEDSRKGFLRDYLGPLITISLQDNVKHLDFMPMITRDTTLPSLRLQSGFGDIIIMDGQARIEYAHSVPESSGLRHSLCFKFKQFPHKLYYGEYNEILHTELIYSIPPWNNKMDMEDLPDEVPQCA